MRRISTEGYKRQTFLVSADDAEIATAILYGKNRSLSWYLRESIAKLIREYNRKQEKKA